MAGALNRLLEFAGVRRPTNEQSVEVAKPTEPTAQQLFLTSLPTTFPVCGYSVTIALRDDGNPHVSVSEVADPGQFPECSWYGARVQAERDEVKRFMAFYFRTPIAPRMLTFDSRRSPSPFRLAAINHSVHQWRAMHGACGRDNRLKKSMLCTGYQEAKSYSDSLCDVATKSPSGLCRHHDKPNARTLWNYMPQYLVPPSTQPSPESLAAVSELNRILRGQ
jgi:hypothetical protein